MEVAHPPGSLSESEARAAGLLEGLREDISGRSAPRWLAAYAGTILFVLILFKAFASGVRFGGVPPDASFADYSSRVQYTLLGLAAFWGLLAPLASHWSGRLLGAKTPLRADCVLVAMYGTVIAPLAAAAFVLLIRGNIASLLAGLPAVAALTIGVDRSLALKGLRSWRSLTFTGAVFAYWGALPAAMLFGLPLSFGYPGALDRDMDLAAVAAAHPHDLAPQDNAATAYRVAGELTPPDLRWFLEGSRRQHADFQPDLRLVRRTNPPDLSAPLRAARAAVAEARRLQQAGDMTGAGRIHRAVLAFLQHLTRQENHELAFALAHADLVGAAFDALAEFVADRRLPESQGKALLLSVRLAKLSRARFAQSVASEFVVDHAMRRAFLRRIEAEFFRPGAAGRPSDDLKALVRADIAAARQAVLAVDPVPLIARKESVAREIRAATGGAGEVSSFACVWRARLLALCAYDRVPSMDATPLPAYAALSETRLLLIETALRLRLDPSIGHRLPEDPFAPGTPLKWRESEGMRTLYSVGPDRKDQGGAPLAESRGEFASTADGDVLVAIPNP